MNETTASSDLHGRTLLMSGGSRGIGLAIAVAAARQGANIVLLAKTADPHPKLPGTIHTAAAEIEAAGGAAAPVVGDVRSEDDVRRAVGVAVERFGRIDAVVNNASAIDLSPSTQLLSKKLDLMLDINVRGTYLLTTAALPYLTKAPQPHILTLSPPLNLKPHWLARHPAYTTSKYAMTLLTLGWAAEFAAIPIAANCLWPQTLIATAAVDNVVGGDRARTPDIMADAAVALLARPATATGRTLRDSEVLAELGIKDLSRYGTDPELDLYVDPDDPRDGR
ncbi:SDR family oxidoreductase [Streptomyces sp. UG1]|uniref:SDR family oxidoreductase n=1 Tax=Streptomyces sp. UG1 TaxID=3417652 RepID=UPI003CF84A15